MLLKWVKNHTGNLSAKGERERKKERKNSVGHPEGRALQGGLCRYFHAQKSQIDITFKMRS